MKEEKALFYLLDSVDSTNNYAMANVHAGMATHGMAWFANEQTNGKGQRGKSWEAASGKNIILSMVVKPPLVLKRQPFLLSCLIATACAEFIQSQCSQHIAIKWPNDLFWRDRKAGGILIENVLAGDEWKWAVVGIGINVNQTEFETARNKPVSLQEIAGREMNPETLTRQLHQFILKKIDKLTPETAEEILKEYNERLYKRNAAVTLKIDGEVVETTVKIVNEKGQLITEDNQQRQLDHGTVEWLLS